MNDTELEKTGVEKFDEEWETFVDLYEFEGETTITLQGPYDEESLDLREYLQPVSTVKYLESTGFRDENEDEGTAHHTYEHISNQERNYIVYTLTQSDMNLDTMAFDLTKDSQKNQLEGDIRVATIINKHIQLSKDVWSTEYETSMLDGNFYTVNTGEQIFEDCIQERKLSVNNELVFHCPDVGKTVTRRMHQGRADNEDILIRLEYLTEQEVERLLNEEQGRLNH
ncbi:hypothetical protein ABC345_01400 [Shouchella sp. 1P09AA]|uniref:hypothetical protein n=1 Tax=unclassified Shouchella TaxID=2893065 RepID=UPI0039A1C459